MHGLHLHAVFVNHQDVPATVGQGVVLGNHEEPAQHRRRARNRAVKVAKINDRRTRNRITRQNEKAVLAAQHIQMLAGLIVRAACEPGDAPG